MSKQKFIRNCEELHNMRLQFYLESLKNLVRIIETPVNIKKWAEVSNYFSEDIGEELLRLIPSFLGYGHGLDLRINAVLASGDKFEENEITTKLPCINVGGNGDGLFPVLFFRSRHLIVVDPSFSKYGKESKEFDFGRGKEKLTLEHVPKKIQDYDVDFPIGSIMINCLDADTVPYVFDFSKESLVKGGYLFRSPSASPRGELFKGMMRENRTKDLFYVSILSARNYGLQKIPVTDSEYDLYKKIE